MGIVEDLVCKRDVRRDLTALLERILLGSCQRGEDIATQNTLLFLLSFYAVLFSMLYLLALVMILLQISFLWIVETDEPFMYCKSSFFIKSPPHCFFFVKKKKKKKKKK